MTHQKEPMIKHTIEALCRRSDEVARKSGWVDDKNMPSYAIITALFHSELSEALEDYRNNKLVTEVWYECKGMTFGKDERDRSKEPPGDDPSYWKPCGVPVELADFVIRICQWAGTAKEEKALQSDFCLHREDTRRAAKDFGHLLAELHGLVSHAYREFEYEQRQDLQPKEYLLHLAGALARLFVFCEASAIDLWAAIDEKEAYNRTRSFRHGGKKV